MHCICTYNMLTFDWYVYSVCECVMCSRQLVLASVHCMKMWYVFLIYCPNCVYYGIVCCFTMCIYLHVNMNMFTVCVYPVDRVDTCLFFTIDIPSLPS